MPVFEDGAFDSGAYVKHASSVEAYYGAHNFHTIDDQVAYRY
jgi:hypothetical protein